MGRVRLHRFRGRGDSIGRRIALKTTVGPDLELEAARRAVGGFAIPTPLLFEPELSARAKTPIYLKLECLQVTGSFKIRGAANRITALTEEQRRRGVVACSSGNHGKAVAHVAGACGIPAVICTPEWVDPVKRSAMERAGARVLADGKTYDEADAQAGELQRQEGMTLVHPFDDPLVIAGQGTLALEIQEELPDVAEILVPLSGGGLAAGVAYALKSVSPHATVTAVSAQRASVMLESLAAGKPIEMAEEGTIASALSGGIGLDNTYTFAMVRDWIDRHLSVPEEAILEAMAYALSHLHLVVEGGGAVALAAILAGLWVPLSDSGPTVIVLSGGNLDPKRLHEVALGDRLRH